MFVGSKKYLKSRKFKDLQVDFRNFFLKIFFFIEKVTFSHIFKGFFHFKVKFQKAYFSLLIVFVGSKKYLKSRKFKDLQGGDCRP